MASECRRRRFSTPTARCSTCTRRCASCRAARAGVAGVCRRNGGPSSWNTPGSAALAGPAQASRFRPADRRRAGVRGGAAQASTMRRCWPICARRIVRLDAYRGCQADAGGAAAGRDRAGASCRTARRRCWPRPLRAAGIGALLDDVLSVEQVGVFKPDPRVYRLATRAFRGGCRQRLAFVSSNPWDAFGARHFGFRVFWVNRARPAGRVRAARRR